MRTRIAITAVAVITVVVAIAMATTTRGPTASHPAQAPPRSDAPAPLDRITLTFAVSPEKEALIRPLVAGFNARNVELDGRPVHVALQVRASGEAEREIATSRFKPVIWSPASSLWGRLLNYDADARWVPDVNPSLARTPLVIGMWEPMAKALGYPKRPVGWQDLIDLTLAPEGWASLGEQYAIYGRMKLGHTNPDFSTSGLAAVAAQYAAAAGRSEGLSRRDVSASWVRQQVRDLQRAIVHYGDTTLFFTDQMERHGAGYASALAVEEATLVEFNDRARGMRLVAIPPKEGTYYSDNPFIVLDAPWVSAQARRAAAVFGRWLVGRITPEQAGSYGFRPADPALAPSRRISTASGAGIVRSPRPLAMPSPEVLALMREQWREDRKPANVMVVVDTSGSMSEEGRLESAKRGLLNGFLPQLSPHDRVGLMTFSSDVHPLIPMREIGTQRNAVRARISSLIPEGETAVIDATAEAHQAVLDLRDDSRINAVVVLTDGEDTSSSTRLSALVETLRSQAQAEGRGVRVFTIAYSAGAAGSREALQIADASGGEAYVGDTGSIAEVYQQISSFF